MFEWTCNIDVIELATYLLHFGSRSRQNIVLTPLTGDVNVDVYHSFLDLVNDNYCKRHLQHVLARRSEQAFCLSFKVASPF